MATATFSIEAMLRQFATDHGLTRVSIGARPFGDESARPIVVECWYEGGRDRCAGGTGATLDEAIGTMLADRDRDLRGES